MPVQIPPEELERRRPLWQALADLFLDIELQDYNYEYVAKRVAESGYSLPLVGAILWDEVFPVVEWNLRHPAGEWTPFNLDWLEKQIRNTESKESAATQPGTAAIVREAWVEVCRYLPGDPL